MIERAWHEGGCHCGAVRFAAELPPAFEVEECNCSICAKSGNLHVILPASRFRLLRGAENLTEYRFNTGVAIHRFCRTCGVKSYYTPRSNSTGVAVTWRCLDTWASFSVTICAFDGINWEQNAARLAHKSDA